MRRASLVLLVLVLSGCTASPRGGWVADDPRPPGPAVFPAHAVADYQLGQAYPPAEGTGIVVRDRTESPVNGAFSVCYLNAFQSQPGADAAAYDGILLLDDDTPVVDPDWPDETLLDTSTDATRRQIAALVGGWIDGCADNGFQAVELDNLDSWTRSHDLLTQADNLALAELLVDRAHARDLLVAQKNTAELGRTGKDVAGFDFAVVEECAQFDECSTYTDVYGSAVVAVEYADAQDVPFATACAAYGATVSMVLRDRELVGPDDPAYVRQTCP